EAFPSPAILSPAKKHVAHAVFQASPRRSGHSLFRTDWICHPAQARAFDRGSRQRAREGVQPVEAAVRGRDREFSRRLAGSVEPHLQASPPAGGGKEEESLRLLRGRGGLRRVLSGCGWRRN